jgi:hypothetical protein
MCSLLRHPSPHNQGSWAIKQAAPCMHEGGFSAAVLVGLVLVQQLLTHYAKQHRCCLQWL